MSALAVLNIVLAVGLVLVVAQPRGLRAVALHPKTPARIARAVTTVLRVLGQAVAYSIAVTFTLYVVAGAVAEAAGR